MKTGLFINGEWVAGAPEGRFDVLNPADESVLAQVESASIDHARAAIEAAAAAAEGWAARTPRERSDVLRGAYELFLDRLDRFVELITLENGKGYVDSRGEALYAAEFFRWYAEEAVRVPGALVHGAAML